MILSRHHFVNSYNEQILSYISQDSGFCQILMENGLIFIPANSKILSLTVNEAKNGSHPSKFKGLGPFIF